MPPVLTVMTLNIWNLNRWEERRQAIVDWINEVRPDLLALQEVVRMDQLCQASWLAEKTGMTAAFGTVGSLAGVEFGNAVLSRFSIVGQRSRLLTDGANLDAPRGIVTADVDAGGRLVSCSSTHLSYRFEDGWAREQQVRQIADLVGEHSADFPPIVCGDFNAAPEATEVRFMTGLHALDGRSFHLWDAFGIAHPDQAGYTWNNANPFAAAEHEPNRRIDYIFVGARAADGAGDIVDASVVCDQPRGGVWPSDHFGVAATLLCPPLIA